MEPSFYAVIPATVRYNSELPDGAKLLYGEITALCNQKGYCWANNEYFAKLYSCSERTISRWISALARNGFLLTLVDKENSNSRKIWLPESQNITTKTSIPMDKNVYTYGQKRPEPMDKNVYYNNTVNNTSNNTVNDIAAKPQTPLPNESKKMDVNTPSVEENPKDKKSFKGGAARKSDYLEAEIAEVVEYLNEKVGLDPKNGFRKSKSTAAHIRQRIAENYTVDDIKAVIEHKCQQWANDPKMCDYLRPQTLFGTGKFESYLFSARKWQNAGRPKQASTPLPTHSQRSGIAFLGADKSIYQEEKQAF